MPAFLITAHDQPHLLKRLVSRLSPHPVFIHINRAVRREEFQVALSNESNASILPEKMSLITAWGGFSLVKAQIALIEESLSSIDQDDYLVSLTGRDYPLRPIENFCEFLKREPNIQHLGYFAISEKNPDFRRFIEKMWFYDLTARIGLSGMRNSARRASNRALNSRFRKSIRTLKYLDTKNVYCGYPRFAITKACYLELRDENFQEEESFFRYGHAPDDMFFQTLIENSRFSTYASPGQIDFIEGNPKQSLINAIPNYWCKENYQYTITNHNLEHLRSCTAFFARKFCEKESKEVLAAIDSLII